MKGIPENIGSNCNIFYPCKFANTKMVLEDIYDEVSNSLTEKEFIHLYIYCLDDDYGALVIDMSHKKKRFCKGWKTELFIST